MASTDFTSIMQVQETYGIKYTQDDYIQYSDIEPSPTFVEEFAFSQRHINVFASEAARCENVIYPVLREVYKKYADCFTLWSHQSISCDAELSGPPDYLISTKSTLGKTVLGSPIIVIVEAKRSDFSEARHHDDRDRVTSQVEGWGQCLAELVAAQRMNGDDTIPVYGIVTDGALWEFGKLEGNLFTQNESVLAISDLKRVFGAIGYLMHLNLPAVPEPEALTA